MPARPNILGLIRTAAVALFWGGRELLATYQESLETGADRSHAVVFRCGLLSHIFTRRGCCSIPAQYGGPGVPQVPSLTIEYWSVCLMEHLMS